MKTTQLLLLLFLLLLTNYGLMAQEEAEEKDRTAYIIPTYDKDVISIYKEGIAENKKKDTIYLFPEKTLNIFFNQEVSSYFNGSGDLSTQQYYITLDASDNSFSFAYNARLGGSNSKIEKMDWLLTVGLKAKSSNRFTELYKNGEFTAQNAGATIKFTNIGLGTLTYTAKTRKDALGNTVTTFDRKKIIEDYRKNYLYEAYEEKIKKYITNTYSDDSTKLAAELNYSPLRNRDAVFLAFAKGKTAEFYTQMAEEEIAYIKARNLYKFFTNNWWTYELFIPFADTVYEIVDADASEPYEKEFYPFSASVAWTWFKKWSTGQSIYFTPKVSIFNNNPIVAGGLSTTTLQTSNTSVGNAVLISTDDVYQVENYKNFETGRLELEVVTFLYKDIIGFSPSVEFNAGKYNETNWKLGIPVSLKDKKGKPTINFELQWKEIKNYNKNANHFIGISANFLFGKFVN